MELDLASMHQLAVEQGIDRATLDDALSEALLLAYQKTPHAAKHARVELDERAGTFTVWARDEEPGEPTEEDPHPAPVLGEEYDDTPKDFGRLAAATARQVFTLLFRKVEDEKVFGAFSGQKGKLVTGIVQQDVKDPANVHIAVGDVEALLPRREQVPGERYRHGERLRVYVVNVARGVKGPEIVVSRSHPELVRRLFEREVPELVSGAVSIMAIAREAGARTKIAVRANTEGVNPKGALIGPGGARVRAVMENLGPEKIDIVDYSNDPAKFVAAALSPAVATGVQVISEKNKTAIAFIHDDQLSLAIGKEGQNARLAAKLTGWKIGIESAEAHAAKVKAKAAQQEAQQPAGEDADKAE
ncbi:transcription termination factor NusA [Bifidobacterium vespertilionis]|uniref:Transcription termination/antitermination protein NusA n=1 Tax=Bifidobacterium vespertilionis TaxID=2562524 RepID=A0A5J5E5T0_9BIFI|nr:transcription termination factor NusA [Bifidobacterium vespertilionis]KAA8821315.1 transcription termination/antitermination protein NusA [Bifidobacterium vespertilionis]KAA8824260.1 transcription termination/antitermination protein NusA [Bifidobacterium vespertilionis]MBT1178592.1 transcription termination/antitermination protein NusA [Bifidobacterium vespertilionis]